MVKKVVVKTALVLRTCSEDMSSKNGFVWPGVGKVATAPDWIANEECGKRNRFSSVLPGNFSGDRCHTKNR